MKRLILALVLLTFLVGLTVTSKAVTFVGVNIPNSVQVDNETLNLNGYGIRYFRLLFIKVKVYVGYLYSDIKQIKSANELINNNGPKVIVMHFLHTVKAKQIRDTFVKDFRHNFKKILEPTLLEINILSEQINSLSKELNQSPSDLLFKSRKHRRGPGE